MSSSNDYSLDAMTRSRDFWQRKFNEMCEENARLRAALAGTSTKAPGRAVLDAEYWLVQP